MGSWEELLGKVGDYKEVELTGGAPPDVGLGDLLRGSISCSFSLLPERGGGVSNPISALVNL